MQLVIAKDLYPEKLQGDEPEPLEVIPWSLDNLEELLVHPEFYEARSIAALLLVAKHYDKQ
jgi:ADP-ribose diphosphatase